MSDADYDAGVRRKGDAMSENKAVPLLPCPFCGSTKIDPSGWASIDRAGPACDDCGATADTADIWNARAAPQPAAPLGGRDTILQVLDKFGIEKGHPCRSDMADAILAAIPQERGYTAALENLREAWTALAMIRETIETLGPIGAVKASEHLDGPTFMHEADALVAGIRALAGKETGR